MKKSNRTPVVVVVWRHWSPIFRKNGWMLFFTVFFYSASMYFDLLLKPSQWKIAFDSLVTHTDAWPAFKMVALAVILGWITSRLGEVAIIFAESRIIKQLKDYALFGLLGKSMHFFTSHSSGGLVAKARRFAGDSENVIDEFVFSIIRSALFIFFLAIYSFVLIPELAPVFLLWISVFVTVVILFSRFRMKYDLISSNSDSTTTAHLADILLSVFFLRSYTAISDDYKGFMETTDTERKNRFISWNIGNLQQGVQGLLVVLLELYCMRKMVLGVEIGIHTIGTAVLVQSYIASLGTNMWNLGRSLIKVRTSFANAFEMSHMLDDEKTEPVLHDSEIIPPDSNEILIEDVTFGYDERIKTISNFSFKFEAGKRYGLVGKTGSGKSTLTKLIMRFAEPNDGSIYVNGTDVRLIDKNKLRSWISYVPQIPDFPSRKIRDIIALGKKHASIEEIKCAAEKACCDFIWETLPNGFDTYVGDRGIKLSGGERQRLTIATAILKDAPIVIMDEPTSALDAKTESSIQNSIKNHFSGKTLLVVAHRLSTVAILDEIIVIGEGQFLESGSHDELLLKSDEYKEMWTLQTNPHLN